MNGYLIARFDMTDPEAAPAAYKAYAEAAGPNYAKHHARFLVRGGAAHPMEGDNRTRNVVIEFPTVADAYACNQSPDYQAARQHRLPVAEGEIVIVEGTVKARPAQEGKKGYWIARYDVRDPAVYKKYVEAGASAFVEHEALFLARGGPHQAMEGQARDRNVIIEFPSLQHALDCYNSAAYQKAREHRLPVSTGEIVIVQGVG
jgi:uncharacterized protein (DUF1330 family)